MKVLSFSYSEELFMSAEQALGDTLERSLGYSKHLEYYWMIIHALKKKHFQSRQISDNFSIIPTNGSTRLHSLINMLNIANTLCSSNHIDLIQSQEPLFAGFVALLLKKKYDIPVNICLYGGNIYDRHWLQQKLLYRAFAGVGKYVLKKADGIQVEGSLIKESLIMHGIDAHKIFVKPMVPHNLNDFSVLHDKEIRTDLLKDTTYEHIILFVGRLIKEKNLTSLLRSIKLVVNVLPRTLLVVIGNGDQADALLKASHQLSLDRNLKWIKHIAHAELPRYYNAADVFVLFSTSEGFPRVLMEAAAAGLPIVCSKISGSTDAIHDGETGFIVDINDISAFAEKIMLLLQNNAIRTRMANAAPQYIKKIGTFDENIIKQIRIWENIIKEY